MSTLTQIDHIVVLMLENRSFDHMLGYLYPGNKSPSGAPFAGTRLCGVRPLVQKASRRKTAK